MSPGPDSPLDKQVLVNNLMPVPGNTVAHSIFPSWMKTIKTGYSDSNPLARNNFDLNNRDLRSIGPVAAVFWLTNCVC
jgi:hypothetical protein